MSRFYNIILRILIFSTIVVIAFAFFNKSGQTIKNNNEAFGFKIETYFKYQDSLLVNGKFSSNNNIVSLSGNIKSLSPVKIGAVELIFQQFDDADKLIGQETLLINKEIEKNKIISFKKEGFTLDKKTKYILIIPNEIK